MAKIVVNEYSQSYTYNTGTGSYCEVALPIASCWGPCNAFSASPDYDVNTAVDMWNHFDGTAAGLQEFVRTYGGPIANYRTYNDYSYYKALSLLSAGYDVLVQRISFGSNASLSNSTTTISAKYPGSFGNRISVQIKSESTYFYIIVYVDKSAVENIRFARDESVATEDIPVYTDIESNYITMSGGSDFIVMNSSQQLTGGQDCAFGSQSTGDLESLYGVPEEDAAEKLTLSAVFQIPGQFPTGAQGQPNPNIIGRLMTAVHTDAGGQKSDFIGTGDVPAAAQYAYASQVKKFVNANINSYVVGGWGMKQLSTASPYLLVSNPAAKTAKGIGKVTISLSTSTSGTNVDVDVNFDDMTVKSNAGGIFAPVGSIKDDNSIEFLTAFITSQNIQGYAGNTQFIALASKANISGLSKLFFNQFMSRFACVAYRQLADKLAHSPNRMIYPWDDLRMSELSDNVSLIPTELSPTSVVMANIAANTRCATAYLDVPKDMKVSDTKSYAEAFSASLGGSSSLLATNSAMFCPWGKYNYVTMSSSAEASPSFLTLLIQRSMIQNQSLQYEWMLPSSRTNTVKVSDMQYAPTTAYLNLWQAGSGASVNAIAKIPGLGTTLYGNSTLYDLPVATYQALSNLSTRLLFNAIKNRIFECGMAITFTYNNNDAYSAFYAGVTPLLDSMKNAGAIDGYRVQMSQDIDSFGTVNANSVVGKITLQVNGVINDITIDLVAIPSSQPLE